MVKHAQGSGDEEVEDGNRKSGRVSLFDSPWPLLVGFFQASRSPLFWSGSRPAVKRAVMRLACLSK